MMKIIENGTVTSAKGFLASGVAAGIKVNRLDMSIIASDRPAVFLQQAKKTENHLFPPFL